MYITSLKIQNLRCFEQAELTFQYPGREQPNPPKLPNINLLLGNNGAGKTTVLRAIALTTLSPIMSQSGYLPYRLVRRTNTGIEATEAELSASVMLHEWQDLNIQMPEFKNSQKPFNLRLKVIRKRDIEILETDKPGKDTLWSITMEMYNDKAAAFLVIAGCKYVRPPGKNTASGSERA